MLPAPLLRCFLRRHFSASPRCFFATVAASPAALNPDLLKITHSQTPKPIPPSQTLKFGHSFSDHMLLCPWTRSGGWETPQIVPFGNLSIPPSASSLHYSLQCFEGMKAYVDKNDRIRLFRPEMNFNRLSRSSARLCMPEVDSRAFSSLLVSLLKLEKRWIPRETDCSLYIRPTMISTEMTLGVGVPNSCLLYVILCPVGPYYPEGFKPVSLTAYDNVVRASPGGTGAYKLGSNYGGTIAWQRKAMSEGFSQVLWLHGEERFISEVGTMNFFVFWENKQGATELVTAPLDGIVLPGVTRDSILQLCREWGIKITERYCTMNELVEAVEQNRVKECFGAGTAAIVSPVKLIQWRDHKLQIPLDRSDPARQSGPLTQRLKDTITGIQYGNIPHEWSVLVE